jgi:hypothetical protein
MDAETREILTKIQETQIIILAEIIDLDKRMNHGSMGHTDRTSEAAGMIKKLRSHAASEVASM